MRISLYSQQRHVLIVDGIPLSGFAEGDYLQVKADGNAATRTQGGDGPAMNLTAAQGGQVTIGLLPTSPAIGLLYGVRDVQATQPRLFSIVLMTGTEEVIQAAGCAFGDLPQFQTGGPAMQPRQFLFEALEIKMDQSAVEAVAGGLVGGLV